MPAAAAIIPLVAAAGGALMKNKAQGKAAKQAAANDLAQQNYGREQGLRQTNEYNANRTSAVQKHRDMLKALIMNKGWGGSKVWDQFGGMDAFFGRPVGGLKSVSEFDPANAAPQAQTSAGGGWNLGGDLAGAAGQAFGAYKSAQAGNAAAASGARGQAVGLAGGDVNKAASILDYLQKGYNPNNQAS